MKGTNMAEYDNNNTFALFKNDKQGNEKRPDYTGTITVNGEEMRMSAWIRESKTGNKYMSGQVQPKRDAKASDIKNEPPVNIDDMEDDMPW